MPSNQRDITEWCGHVAVYHAWCGHVAVHHDCCGHVAVYHAWCGHVAVYHAWCGHVAVYYGKHISSLKTSYSEVFFILVCNSNKRTNNINKWKKRARLLFTIIYTHFK